MSCANFVDSYTEGDGRNRLLQLELNLWVKDFIADWYIALCISTVESSSSFPERLFKQFILASSIFTSVKNRCLGIYSFLPSLFSSSLEIEQFN